MGRLTPFLFVCLFSVALVAPAGAKGSKSKQTLFELDKGKTEYSFKVRWKDVGGSKRTVRFDLPASATKRDLAKNTGYPEQKAAEYKAAAIKKYAKTLGKGTKLTVSAKKGVVRIRVSGRNRAAMKKALKGAKEVEQQALDEFLAKRGYFRLKKNKLSFDHARLVGDYADDMEPVAAALAKGTSSDREFVERALSFVQSIPYEKKARGKDAGYRRPMALLARNKGDCDGKSVLFLAILKAHDPDLPVAVCYVRNHMLVGVGLEPQKGDKTFRHDQQKYIYAEPVGPALEPLGDAPAGHRAQVAGGALVKGV